jgi:SAM-dependent methyltransferase
MTAADDVRILDQRTREERDRPFLPGMGRTWLLPLYDVFTRVSGVRALHERAAALAGIAPGQAVVSSLALHHVDDDGRVGFAQDALRTLRPGGKITIVDFGGPTQDTEDAHHPAHSHGPGHALRHLPSLIRSRVAQSPVVARNHGDGIVALLAAAGFGDAREVVHVDTRFGRVTFVQATRP